MNKLTKTETHYHAYLDSNVYEDFNVIACGGNIKIELYKDRWRTKEESIELLKAAIRVLEDFKL